MAVRGPWPLMLRTCWVLGRRMTRLSGALVFQVIGQQISVIAATAIFARLTGHFGGRGRMLARSRPSAKRLCMVWDCHGARLPPSWIWRSASATGACPRPS